MSKKSVFLGGALSESQYLFTLPIVAGYCKSKKIDKIILEKNLTTKVKNNKIIKDIIKDFKIENLEFKQKKFFQVLRIIFFQLHKIIYFIYKIFFFKPDKDFLTNQYCHAIWDTALRMMRDNQTKPNLTQILEAIIRILNASYFSKKIIDKKCYAAFMGHNVYTHKVVVSELVNAKVNVYCQVMYSYFKKDLKESFWGTVTIEELKKISNRNEVKKYYKQKTIGRGNYEDSNLAARKKNQKRKKIAFPKNVVFLHIFRDSPFGIVDNSRIFKDYFEWIKSTIKIINKSNEKWLFKIHPSVKRWGEDSEKILNNLLDQYCYRKKNIIIDNGTFSNFDIFKHSERIVTFNGTSHIESIASGLKPIIISDCSMTSLDKKLFYKPKNLKEYENLLIKKNNFKIYSKEKMLFAQKVIYFIENFKSFGKDLKIKQTYANDSKKIIDEEYSIINKKLKKNLKYFNFLGKRLADGDMYTYAKNFYAL